MAVLEAKVDQVATELLLLWQQLLMLTRYLFVSQVTEETAVSEETAATVRMADTAKMEAVWEPLLMAKTAVSAVLVASDEMVAIKVIPLKLLKLLN